MFYQSLYCIIPCCILTSCRVMSRAAMFRRRCLFRVEFWLVLPRHVLVSAALYYVILFCLILSMPVSSCYVLFFNIAQSCFYRLLSYLFLCCHVVSFAVLFFPIRLNSGMPSVVLSSYVWCAAVLSWFFFAMFCYVLTCIVLFGSLLSCLVSYFPVVSCFLTTHKQNTPKFWNTHSAHMWLRKRPVKTSTVLFCHPFYCYVLCCHVFSSRSNSVLLCVVLS